MKPFFIFLLILVPKILLSDIKLKTPIQTEFLTFQENKLAFIILKQTYHLCDYSKLNLRIVLDVSFKIVTLCNSITKYYNVDYDSFKDNFTELDNLIKINKIGMQIETCFIGDTKLCLNSLGISIGKDNNLWSYEIIKDIKFTLKPKNCEINITYDDIDEDDDEKGYNYDRPSHLVFDCTTYRRELYLLSFIKEDVNTNDNQKIIFKGELKSFLLK